MRDDRAALARLVEAGADVNAAGPTADTALHWAAWNGDLRSARLLLDHGADVNACVRDGDTALHQAAYAGHAAMVSLLLARGARVDARTVAGLTPLHWAAGNGHLDVVHLLLAAGADPSARDRDGRTPRDLASAAGHDGVVRLLDGFGAHGPRAPTTAVLIASGDESRSIVAEPARTKAGAVPGRGRYRIQVAAMSSEASAHTAWRRISARNADLVRGLGLSVEPVPRPADGTLYRVRAGPLDAGAARAVCEALARRGQPCLVVAPSP